MRRLEGLSKPKTQVCRPPNEKHHTSSHLGGLGASYWSRGLKKENVYKVEQDVGGVEKKCIHELHPPFFPLQNLTGLPFLFFCQRRKKNRISFNPQRGLAGRLRSCASGCSGGSRGSGSSAGTSSALETQEQKMLRRRRPGGLSARGRAARRRAPAGRRLRPRWARRLASVGAAGTPSPGRGWPPGLPA